MSHYRDQNPDHHLLKMPPLEGEEYIVRMVMEAGLVSTNGMGPTPLSWQEIEAWMRTTASNPSLWERLLIREISEVYVGEFGQASDPQREDPYTHIEKSEIEDIEEQRRTISSKLLNGFRAFQAARNSSRKSS